MITSKPLIRYCDTLGVHYVDRDKSSCVHATTYCASNCYYNKFMQYPSVRQYLKKASFSWKHLAPGLFHGVPRVRLCRVGDPFASRADIGLVRQWAEHNPGTRFWAPTRAFRSTLRDNLLTLPSNVKVLASLDPSNTWQEITQLVNDGFSTMFFGDDNRHPLGKAHKCPKTWQGKKLACKTCKAGCFNSKQVHVWLKKH